MLLGEYRFSAGLLQRSLYSKQTGTFDYHTFIPQGNWKTAHMPAKYMRDNRGVALNVLRRVAQRLRRFELDEAPSEAATASTEAYSSFCKLLSRLR